MDTRVSPRDMMSSSSEPQAVAGAEHNGKTSSDSGDEQASESGDDDDDDYAGVEDVEDMSDDGVEDISDDDVEDMSDNDEEDTTGVPRSQDTLRAVEIDLIDEFERTEEKRIASDMTADLDTMFLQTESTRQPSISSAGILTDLFDVNVNMDEDPFLGLASHDDVYMDMYDEAEDALASWRKPERQDSEESVVAKKRVRFMEPQETRSRSSSLSSDEEDPGDAFPDLFAAQDDPMSRTRLGLNVDLDIDFQNDYSDAGSCYDFDGEEERLALAIDQEDSDSDEQSSTEDDDGDTTDEETEEDLLARTPTARGVTRSPTVAPATPMPAKRLVIRETRNQTTPLATPKTGKGPKMGTFAVDRSRATMSADTIANRIKVLPPSRPLEKDKAFWDRAKIAASNRSGTPRSSGYWNMRTLGPELPQRPFTAQSTLGSMFNGNLDILRNNDVAGIAGELFPGMVPLHDSSFVTASMAEDSDDEFPEINMEDFLDMDQSESEEEEDQSAAPVTSPTQAAHTPDGLTHTRNDRLLDHLDSQRDLVGSFRRNQNNAKHLSSLAANPASRASTSEYNALQKGKRAAANIPVTPARKKRVSQDLTGAGVRKGGNSPLANRRPRSRGSSISAGAHQRLGLSNTQ